MSVSTARSVAIIGAGASGAAAAAAFDSEDIYDTIRVFERRGSPGGTWNYDPDPGTNIAIQPGKLPPETDPPLRTPDKLPETTEPSSQQRYDTTPIYAELTTNVPEIAMSFSDRRFPYGPFVPHWIPKQYVDDYFSRHRIDSFLVLNTTVEDLIRVRRKGRHGYDRWKLTLRRFEPTRNVDIWWEEEFDAVILANGHYSVPFIPAVKGLEQYMSQYPDRVTHSKSYRVPNQYQGKRVLIIGNSASGHDITTLLVQSGKPELPVYQSRRSRSRFDGAHPPIGVDWKPTITEYKWSTNEIIFEDGTGLSNIDAIIYCTGYNPSYPFWNESANGGPLYDYETNHLLNSYQHTFFRNFPYTLGMIGLPRVLTFRSFEYQAVALARLFTGRNAKPLPSSSAQDKWERERLALVRREKRKFHDIQWDNNETMEWFQFLFELSGLPLLKGEGRYPPIMGAQTRWAIEHVRKYPVPDDGDNEVDMEGGEEWVIVGSHQTQKDSLHFI